MRPFFAELHRNERALSTAAWVSLALGVMAMAATLVDPRTILGIDPWIKPAKFLFSFFIYFLTLAWLLPKVDAPRTVRVVRWATLLTMMGEIVCIAMQAARGTTSHFNARTFFDAMVFAAMGTLILINTIAIALLLIAFVRRSRVGDRALRMAVIFGLVLFLGGSLQAFIMVAVQGHTVGAPDGGPGLPLVNWSTRFGDLRIAHFIGLHGLQMLPLLAFLMARRTAWAEGKRVAVVVLVGVVWTAAVVALTLQALAGRAFIAL